MSTRAGTVVSIHTTATAGTPMDSVGAARATLYMYLQPFLGVMFAALLIGEQVAPVQVLGGVVIVTGVSLGKLFPGATIAP